METNQSDAARSRNLNKHQESEAAVKQWGLVSQWAQCFQAAAAALSSAPDFLLFLPSHPLIGPSGPPSCQDVSALCDACVPSLTAETEKPLSASVSMWSNSEKEPTCSVLFLL